MRFDRNQLRYLALMALDEIADECQEGPVRKALWLRFLLAWLYHESGADPETKWLFASFWSAATSPVDGEREFIEGYVRSTQLQSSLNGITRALGWERTVTFTHEMQERRRRLASSRAPE